MGPKHEKGERGADGPHGDKGARVSERRIFSEMERVSAWGKV